MIVDVRELEAAIDGLIAYKGELLGKQQLQAAGFEVKNTNATELVRTFNAFSRRAVSALGMENLDRLEALGEMLLNHVRATNSGTYDI